MDENLAFLRFSLHLKSERTGGHLCPIPNTKKPFNKIILSIALATPPGMSMGEYKDAPFYRSTHQAPYTASYGMFRSKKGDIKRLLSGYHKGRYDE
jgi:hypothetical protein